MCAAYWMGISIVLSRRICESTGFNFVFLIFQKYFVLLISSFILGIAIASFLPTAWLLNDILYFTAGIIFIITAIFVWQFRRTARNSGHAFMFACLIALVLIGAWRYSLSEIELANLGIKKFIGKEVSLSGEVVRAPQIMDGKMQIILGDISIQDAKYGGKVLITAYNQRSASFGDKIHLRCNLAAPEPINDFRYDRYLSKDAIVATCVKLKILGVDDFRSDWLRYPGRSLLSVLLKFKTAWREIFMRALPRDEGSLLSGIMLGDGYLMSQDLKDDYSRSGLSHIIAISGMNMTMIAVFLLWLLVRAGLWRREASVAAIALIWLYTLAIGLPSSAVRASTMSSMVLLAYAIGRLSDVERLLILAAGVMLAINPRLLRDDVGFQLSFLAFLGLLWYYEPIKKYLSRMITHRYFAMPIEIVSLTLAAQVMTWPLMAISFGQVSLVAPLANLLVLWALGPMMILALLGLLGSLFMPAGWSLAPAYLLAHWQNLVAQFFGRWQYGVISFSGGFRYLFIIYYCGIIFLTYARRMKKNDQNSSSQKR